MFFIHFVYVSLLFRVSGDSMLLIMMSKCFGCRHEWVLDWTCVEQSWELIYSPRRAHLAQARIAGTGLGFCASARLGDGLYFLATNCLAQARPPRLSESSWNLPGALLQSRLSESLQLEREHSSWCDPNKAYSIGPMTRPSLFNFFLFSFILIK